MKKYFTLCLTLLMVLLVACTKKEEQPSTGWYKILANNCVQNTGWSWNGNSTRATCNNNLVNGPEPMICFYPGPGGELQFTIDDEMSDYSLKVYIDDYLYFNEDEGSVVKTSGLVHIGYVNKNSLVKIVGCNVVLTNIYVYVKHMYTK